ncbi:MAG: A24 family peptidase [Bacillota bacterium]
MTIPDLQFTVSDYLLITLMIICIITDIRGRRIYNKILVPFLIAALAANFFTGGWQHLWDGIKGLAMGLLILIIPFARGGIGAGDVKLLAVIGGIKGSSFVISAFLTGALAGGVFALIVLILNRRLLNTLRGYLSVLSGLLLKYGIVFRAGSDCVKDAKPLYFPYSLAIGAGVATTYMAGLQTFLR